jgi:transcriptional regulator with XRE-family HTH domain
LCSSCLRIINLQRPFNEDGPISPIAREYDRTVVQETLSKKMSSTIPREYRDAFVARVRQARTDAGYTQRAVAMLLGVDASTYNNYERGRGKEPPTLMPMHLIERFCVLCQVPIDWLVTGKATGRSRVLRKPQRPKQQLNLFGANQKRA